MSVPSPSRLALVDTVPSLPVVFEDVLNSNFSYRDSKCWLHSRPMMADQFCRSLTSHAVVIILFANPDLYDKKFGPCSLRLNGWMDEAGTWHGGRLQPRRLCVRWGPSPLTEKEAEASAIFGPFLLLTNGWMHQAATWYGGRPHPRGLCVRWEPSPSPKRGGRAPTFRLTSIVAKRLRISRCHLVRR